MSSFLEALKENAFPVHLFLGRIGYASLPGTNILVFLLAEH